MGRALNGAPWAPMGPALLGLALVGPPVQFFNFSRLAGPNYSNAPCQDGSNRFKSVIVLDIPCSLYQTPPNESCQACRFTKPCWSCQPFERSHVGHVVCVGGQAPGRLCNQKIVASGCRRCPLKWHCLGRVSRLSIESRVSRVVSAESSGLCRVGSFVLWRTVGSSCRV